MVSAAISQAQSGYLGFLEWHFEQVVGAFLVFVFLLDFLWQSLQL